MRLRTSFGGKAGSYPKWWRCDSLSRLRGRVGRGLSEISPAPSDRKGRVPPPHPPPQAGEGVRATGEGTAEEEAVEKSDPRNACSANRSRAAGRSACPKRGRRS